MSLSNLEYLSFIEPHLQIQILEFLSKSSPSSGNVKEALTKLRATLSEKKVATSELEAKLKGFLNLCENCKKANQYDVNTFSLGKKITDETSPLLILDYAKSLLCDSEYEKAKDVLYSFSMLNEGIKKNISKSIFAFYLIYSINILTDQPMKTIENSFASLVNGVEKLKNSLDEEFRKINFEVSGDKCDVSYKQVLLYRGYTIHWALFLTDKNVELFLDTLYDDKYFSMIENVFNYILKYLIVFTIITKSKKFVTKLKEYFKRVDQESDCAFSKLFKSIFISFEVTAFPKLAKEVEEIMKSDFFLYKHIETFLSKCKEIIVENYILINETIDTQELKSIFGDEKKTKEVVVNSIQSLYPNAVIKDPNAALIEYETMDEEEIERFYKNQTDNLYKLTTEMVQFVKEVAK